MIHAGYEGQGIVAENCYHYILNESLKKAFQCLNYQESIFILNVYIQN